MIEKNSKTEHVETDLLAAFAERTLTAHEREAVLLHLADCAECREILFLAQEGLPEEELAVATPARERRVSWFSWKATAVAACLLATVGVLTEEIYQRTHTTSETVAKVTPAQLPQAASNEMVKNSSLSPKVTNTISTPKEMSAPATVTPTNPPALKGVAPTVTQGEAQTTQQSELKSAAMGKFKMTAPPQSTIFEQQNASSHAGLVLKQTDQQQVDSLLKQNNAMHETSMTSSAQMVEVRPLVRSAAAPKAANAPTASAASGMVYAAPPMAPRSSTQTVEVNASAVPLIDTESQSVALKTLPNGQAAQASVTIAGKQLALDQAGRLYASADQGATWHEIQKQWNGNATTLTVVPHLSSAESGRKDKLVYSSGGYAVVLRNSANQEWISMDGGSTWKPNAK
jgi:hypothetical protein